MMDLIKRQDAMDVHCAICPDKGKCPDREIDVCPDRELFRMIKAEATDTKNGKWEERKVFSARVVDELQSARCSVCGKYHTTPYGYYFDNYAFCPNCGAKMEDETDGDTH